MFLNLKEIYLPSWEIFAKNWWQYMIITLIMFLLVFVPLIGAMIQIFIMLALINAILKSSKNEVVCFSDFFKFKDVFNKTNIIFAVALGLYYFIIQHVVVLSIIFSLIGAVLSVIYFPIICVLADKKFNLKETVLYSSKLTKNLRSEIVVILLVNILVCIVGAMLLFVGVFAAVPVSIIATVKVYEALDKKQNSQAQI